jgi:hypothetical protein
VKNTEICCPNDRETLPEIQLTLDDKVLWKCGTVQIFGNDDNKSTPDSGGNYEETEFG